MYLLLTDYDTEKQLLVNMDKIEFVQPLEHLLRSDGIAGVESTAYISGCTLSIFDDSILTVKESMAHIAMALRLGDACG